jgi:hypothetical protein
MTDHHPSRQAFQQFQYLTVPLTVGADHTNRALRAVLDRAFGEQGDR